MTTSGVYAGTVVNSNSIQSTSSNPGVPFNPNIKGIQTGVDPNTLIPAKDLSTLSPQRINNAVKYGGGQAIYVNSAGVILDGHHRVAYAIASGQAIDIFVEAFK